MFKLNKAKSTDGKGLVTHYNGLKKSNSSLVVGVHHDAHDYDDGTSVLLVAMLGEFGDASSGLVPRHFLSRSVDIDKAFYKTRMKLMLKRYNKDAPTGLEIMFNQLGLEAKSKVITHIERNDIGMADNKFTTAIAKGGNQPMVDTGHLLRQIDYKLEKR